MEAIHLLYKDKSIKACFNHGLCLHLTITRGVITNFSTLKTANCTASKRQAHPYQIHEFQRMTRDKYRDVTSVSNVCAADWTFELITIRIDYSTLTSINSTPRTSSIRTIVSIVKLLFPFTQEFTI